MKTKYFVKSLKKFLKTPRHAPEKAPYYSEGIFYRLSLCEQIIKSLCSLFCSAATTFLRKTTWVTVIFSLISREQKFYVSCGCYLSGGRQCRGLQALLKFNDVCRYAEQINKNLEGNEWEIKESIYRRKARNDQRITGKSGILYGKAKQTDSANPERINHSRFPQWRGTQVASHLPSVPLASLGEMLSPNTLCENTKNFGGKIYREGNSKSKQSYHLFFPRIGAGTAHHWWESKDKRIEPNGLSDPCPDGQVRCCVWTQRRNIAGTQTARQ